MLDAEGTRSTLDSALSNFPSMWRYANELLEGKNVFSLFVLGRCLVLTREAGEGMAPPTREPPRSNSSIPELFNFLTARDFAKEVARERNFLYLPAATKRRWRGRGGEGEEPPEIN